MSVRARALHDFGLGQVPPGKAEFFDIGKPFKDVQACLTQKDFKPYFNNTQCCVKAGTGYRCKPIAASSGGAASGASTGKQSEGACLRTVQQMLYDAKLLEFQWVDGKWNDRTSTVLAQQLGAGWEKTPGGPCALVGVLQARFGAAQQFTPPPGGYTGYTGYTGSSGASIFGNIDTTTMLMLGIGVVALVLVAKR